MTDTSELWREHLLLRSPAHPKPLLANAITALREAPAWFGVLAYDEFAHGDGRQFRHPAVGHQACTVGSLAPGRRMTTC